jgi:hypothetical protein
VPKGRFGIAALGLVESEPCQRAVVELAPGVVGVTVSPSASPMISAVRRARPRLERTTHPTPAGS